MAKIQLKKSETSVILIGFIQDSSLTTGLGLGSLDQTSSITGGYVKRGGTGVALAVDENVTTEGTYEAPSTAAQVRIGTPANMPTGFYEFHFHNDLFTTDDYVTIGLTGATNMAPLNFEVQLTDIDLNTALASSTVGTVTTNTDMRGTDSAFLAASAPTNFSSLGIESDGDITKVNLCANTTLVDTTTTNTDMLTAAAVNAEVVDALNTDTYAEPAQGAPGATISLAQKIGYLYKGWRNKKLQTATEWSILNDDASTVDHKATLSDDGTTATKTEIESGP